MLVNFCFYVPKTHLEIVKEAIFIAGAGVIGEYSNCCWQTLGEGQFLPSANSSPVLGKQQQLHRLAEYKVEVICVRDIMPNILHQFLLSHPYEEPAYSIMPHLKLEDL
jgi:hypothetical protein